MSEVRKKSADEAMKRESASSDAPSRVLVIRLVPALTLASLLRPLRRRWPSARFCTVTATREGEELIATDSDEVMLTEGIGAREALRRVRAFAPEVTIVAGGADYGLGSTYLKAALLARLSGARQRWQWNPGEALDGPLGGPIVSALAWVTQRRWRDPRAMPDALPHHGGPKASPVFWMRAVSRQARAARWRRYYRRPPACGPRDVQVAITAACNYHCLMCAFHNPAVESRHQESERPRMSYDVFVQLLADLKRSRVLNLGLTGYGEPLTHPRAMEMIARAVELGFRVVPTTNGSLLTEQRGRAFVDMGLPRLHVSLNAGTDELYAKMHPGTPPGRLAQILLRLRQMAEYAEETGRPPVTVRVSAVVTRMNMMEIPEIVRVAQQARALEFTLLPMAWVEGQPDLLPTPEDHAVIRKGIREAMALGRQLGVRVMTGGMEAPPSDDVARPRSIYEYIPCYMGYELCHIAADGKVLFCAACPEPLGDLHTHSFETIWKSQAYERMRQAALALPKTRKAPGDCFCFHGCCHMESNLDVHRWLYGGDALGEIG